MKIVIIEDEKPAFEKIKQFIEMYDKKIEILSHIETIEHGLSWFAKHSDFDLVISDIQLPDGTSFDIFKEHPIQQAVIFTTAYDEFAIEAFKMNSIDYLIKPIRFEDFYQSMEKIERMRESLPSSRRLIELEQLSERLIQHQKNYKTRFMVKVGDHIKSFTYKEIQYFFAEGRDVSLVNYSKREYLVDQRLEELNEALDPKNFFRIGRSFIVNIEAISEVLQYSNSRLKIVLKTRTNHELIVSRDKVNRFKDWFNGID